MRRPIQYFQEKKQLAEPFAMLTCYDATFARILEDAGMEIILIGDSLGNVIKGQKNTLGVTLDDIIYHSRAVARATEKMLIVADMPFGTYQSSHELALKNGFSLIQNGHANAIKLEGGKRYATLISDFTSQGVPVMGHLGLTPQSINQMGGYHVQARSESDAATLLEDARALQQAGCFAIVLECIPTSLAQHITSQLSIPTIGIGAGPHTDAQVLVLYDLLGLTQGKTPKFVRQYKDLAQETKSAVTRYIHDVKSHDFPDKTESYN